MAMRKIVRQTGKSNMRADRKRTAKRPGWRRSKTGKRYWENRRNRSDKNRKKKL